MELRYIVAMDVVSFELLSLRNDVLDNPQKIVLNYGTFRMFIL